MSKSTVERSFGGVLVTAKNYRELDPEQRKLENKHLKGYLKGWPTFRHGFTEIPNDWGLIERVPAIYVTKEIIKNGN